MSHSNTRPDASQRTGERPTLLPCPFCGSDAVPVSGTMAWIECSRCCGRSPVCQTTSTAAHFWNERAPIARPESQNSPQKSPHIGKRG